MKSAHDLVVAAKALIQEIPVEEAERMLSSCDVLLDVREPDEYRAGHLPGAINIPRGLLEFRMSGTPELASPGLQILLYCKTSGRAALAARSLREMGYLNVKSIAGGFDAWAATDRQVVQDELPTFE